MRALPSAFGQHLRLLPKELHCFGEGGTSNGMICNRIDGVTRLGE
jgi:hypothetical protein